MAVAVIVAVALEAITAKVGERQVAVDLLIPTARMFPRHQCTLVVHNALTARSFLVLLDIRLHRYLESITQTVAVKIL